MAEEQSEGVFSCSPMLEDSHQHDGGQPEDARCAVLENMSGLSQANHVLIVPPAFIYVLLPLLIFQLLLSPPVSKRLHGPDPPGLSRLALIANSLWPHAPPR